MTHEFVGLQEVAKVAGKSLSTVNRNLAKLRDYGAYKDGEGVWHVPVTAIEGAGWHVRSDMPRGVSPTTLMASHDTSSEVSDLRTELDSLRKEVSALRGQLGAAEAAAEKWQLVAAERLQNLDDLRRSQRLLEAVNSGVSERGADSATASTEGGAERGGSLVRRWSRFKRG